MAEHPHAIDLGEAAKLTDQSHEVMRIWVTDKAGSNAWINPNLLQDPKTFGYLIADVVRHAAQAYGKAQGKEARAMLQAITDGAVEQLGKVAAITPSQPSQPGSTN